MTLSYQQEPWFALLQSRTQGTPRIQVARQLGISPAALSQVLNGSGEYGKGTASTQRIADRVVHTFGRYPCPHLTAEAGGEPQEVSAEQCRAFAHRPPPTGSPRDMQHWQACRQTFGNFQIEAVKTRYSISGSAKGKQEAAEVLISNFKLA